MIVPVVSIERKLFGCINTFNNLFISCSDCCSQNDDCKKIFSGCFCGLTDDALSNIPVSEADLISFVGED